MSKRHYCHICVGALVFCLIAGSVQSKELVLETGQYKRIHVHALEAILDGNVEGAIQALQDYCKAHPDDAETWYLRALAHGRLSQLDQAMASVKQAVSRGLPVERFLAGPRGLLGPILAYEPFQAYVAGRYAEPIHGPMVGCVTAESAGFWVRTAQEAPVHILLSASQDFDGARRSTQVHTSADRHYTAVIRMDSLDPETRYYYKVIVDGASKQYTAPQSFRTFPKPGEPAAFRVGFGGGAGFVPAHERMWDTIRGYEPLAFLLLGDNVYIDHPAYPAIQEYCYYRRQSRPEFRLFTSSMAIYAIYDDHDFGDNDCWGGPGIDHPAWKRPVWRLFKSNWVDPYYGGGEAQPGCWFDCSIADVDFFFLDCRYYRTDPKQPNPSMLGPAQKIWLFDKLKSSKATFNVLVSSVPWAFGTKPSSLDTWEGFPDEREEIFTFIEQNGIGGVVLLSADRHRSDVWRIEREKGYTLYEFESSRLTNQHVHKKMPGAVFSYNESQSFGLLSFDTTKPDPAVTYSIVNIDGDVIYEITLKRSQLMDA